MLRSLCCMLMLSLLTSCSLTAQERIGREVEIDSTDELYVYYPPFTSLALVCDTMPYNDASVLFCAEAAFTHAIRRTFHHSNIDGNHVCAGVKYAGAECKDNTGMFAWYGGQWHFVFPFDDAVLDSAATDSCGMGFGQTMVIYHKALVMPVRKLTQVTHFRCLCEKDGRLCVIDSKDTVTFGHFIWLLASYGVENALYLDMGKGWNHSWLRTAEGERRELFPYHHPYCTNWIAFRWEE
ncbi:MAG: hypothetical protein J6Y34_08450 [Bacteroidales bacterium]|nr:hypothetical protein [Bacteroidales bacterium]